MERSVRPRQGDPVEAGPTQEGGIDTAPRKLPLIPNTVIRNRVPWQQDSVPATLNA